MEAIDILVRALGFALVALVGLAAIHKVGLLRRSTTPSVLRTTPWLRRNARPLMALAALGEVVTAALLAGRPAVGFAAMSMLMLVYAPALARLKPGESCDCFGRGARELDRRGALQRNALLGATSGVLAGGYLSGLLDIAPVSQWTVGLAVTIASVMTAAVLVDSFGRAMQEKPQ